MQYHDGQVFSHQGRCAINRPYVSVLRNLIGVVLAVALLTACEGGGGVEPTRIPTAIPPTPTIRSTPLPAVSPAPALGQTDARPIVIQIALFGEDPADSARRAGIDLQEALQNELDLEINVQFVDERTALKSLCSGAPTAAWVSPFTYVKAQTQCEVEPVFSVTRGRPTATVGRTAEIIGRADITDLSELEDRVFCRSYEQDYFTSWVFPSLYLAAEGVDPADGLAEIKDYPDNMSLGKALYQGDCAAAALPPDEYEDWLIDLSAFLSTEFESGHGPRTGGMDPRRAARRRNSRAQNGGRLGL